MPLLKNMKNFINTTEIWNPRKYEKVPHMHMVLLSEVSHSIYHFVLSVLMIKAFKLYMYICLKVWLEKMVKRWEKKKQP